MYTNSTVNSTGWTVASDSCAGSRRTWSRLRRVRTATSWRHRRARSIVVSSRPAPAVVSMRADRRRWRSCRTSSRSVSMVGVGDLVAMRSVAGVAGVLVAAGGR